MDEDRDRCCFDDWTVHWSRRVRKGRPAARITASLVEELERAGIRDRSVLDVGCGIGDLAIEVVRRGARGATGLELSRRSVEEARRLAQARGVADRTSFRVGDGARDALPPADVVVLNRVFCCYPDVDALLENSLAAAGAVYAFTTPPSDGFLGSVARLTTRLSNIGYRLRKRTYRGFRIFVHDVGHIDARVRSAGFRPKVSGRRGLGWHLALYVRS